MSAVDGGLVVDQSHIVAAEILYLDWTLLNSESHSFVALSAAVADALVGNLSCRDRSTYHATYWPIHPLPQRCELFPSRTFSMPFVGPDQVFVGRIRSHCADLLKGLGLVARLVVVGQIELVAFVINGNRHCASLQPDPERP